LGCVQTNQIHAPAARPRVDLRRQTEDLLCRLGVYRPARNAYQRLLNRDYYTSRLKDRAFFRDFIPEGGLVFDVGANEGRLTQTFAELGATVVAVEPNPGLAGRVRARYGSRSVTVEATALGDSEGVATLRLGRDSGHSTVSPDWQDAVGDGAEDRWSGSVDVPVTTLDALIARHGTPDFVKIDVEGFEPQVLSGLHEPVAALSFEFLCRAQDIAQRCVAIVSELGSYEFNLAFGEEHGLHGPWRSATTLLEDLAAFAAEHPEGYGDVYARRAQP
jgi:FkbM family methyltransferase